MLNHVVNWMRSHVPPTPSLGGWARWIGRSWAHVTYAMRVEPTWVEINRLTVPVAGLPSVFDGLRIVQLSDIHCGPFVSDVYLSEVVDLARAEEGDVIVLTGDYVHKGFKHIERMAAELGKLQAPLGVFAVLGNHDFSVRNALGIRRYRHLARAVADALSARGIRVLQNESLRLTRADSHIHLSGVDDLWSRVCDLEQALAGLCPTVPRILLAHNPRTIERLDGQRCDLMLSGHTHGGQIDLPGLGRITLGKRVKRFAAGVYQCGGTVLYVNKGVGVGFPVRYRVRPEVAVFTLTGKNFSAPQAAVSGPPELRVVDPT
jgi:predicted MPP superfamily phosphohydrolase